MKSIRAFEVGIRGQKPTTIINHVSRGKAKAQYFVDLDDCFPDLRYTDIEAHSLGRVVQTESFRRTAENRNKPFARIGMPVKVGPYYGNIVGNNSSANFDVLFVSGPHKGLTLGCHPEWMITYYDDQMNIIAEYGRDGLIEKEVAA